MPVSIDFPQESRSPRHRRTLLAILGVVAAILFASRNILSYWVDLLWFGSLGYADVFWKTLSLQWGVFSIFAILTFAIVFATFTALRRAHRNDLPRDHTIVFGGQPVTLSVLPVLRLASWIVSIVGAVVTGASMMDDWPALALWWTAPAGGSGADDPIFWQTTQFLPVHPWPAWHIVLDWLLTMSVAVCLLAVFFLLITGGMRALDKGRITYRSSPWRGLSIAVAFLLIVLAADVFLGRYDMLFEHHTIFDGVNYTDAHLMLTGLLLVCAALVAGAAIAAMNAARNPRGIRLAGALVPAAICYGLLSLVGWYVSNFVVKPNELDRETPYIAHNIEMTRQAYGLDQFSQREFPAETTVEATEPAANQVTLANIRLWDWRALQDTLRQVQEIRTYYDFPDIDIDRYEVNGQMREVMLATRELNVDKLPRQQPQLDQREADLHARIWHYHESGQRIYV